MLLPCLEVSTLPLLKGALAYAWDALSRILRNPQRIMVLRLGSKDIPYIPLSQGVGFF